MYLWYGNERYINIFCDLCRGEKMSLSEYDLEAVADAIRTKGGTSDALTFPGGFVDAVSAIQAGSESVDAALINNELIEYFSDKVTAVNLKFGGLKKLKKLDLPNCKTITSQAFDGCAIKDFNLPSLQSIGWQCFANNSAVEHLVFPSVTATTGASMFSSCTALKVIDYPIISHMAPGNYPYTSCRALEAFILRKSDGIVTLSNSGIFANAPLGGLGGTYSGHVYVPAALIPTYQTATNWATIYAAYPEIFQPIEGSEYE